jgi:Cof subfamily protein (haloacid dehalogenase superfamily)
MHTKPKNNAKVNREPAARGFQLCLQVIFDRIEVSWRILMRRLIVTDLDGTLLKKDTTISSINQAAVEALKSQGHVVAIASGRTFDEIRGIVKSLALDQYEHGYYIGYNGVEAIHALSNTVVHEAKITWEDVHHVWRFVEAYGMHVHVFTKDKVYLSIGIDQRLRLVQDSVDSVRIVDIASIQSDEPVYKVVVLDTPEKCDILRNNIPASLTSRVLAFKSADMLIEFVSLQGSKGHAVKHLAQQLGIKQESVIAFGDEENDLTMIEYAGIGVAMANAKPIIKAMANYMTLSNLDDGFAVALRNFKLIE